MIAKENREQVDDLRESRRESEEGKGPKGNNNHNKQTLEPAIVTVYCCCYRQPTHCLPLARPHVQAHMQEEVREQKRTPLLLAFIICCIYASAQLKTRWSYWF